MFRSNAQEKTIIQIVRQARNDVVSQWSLTSVAERAVERLREIKASSRFAEVKARRSVPTYSYGGSPYSSSYNLYGGGASSYSYDYPGIQSDGRKKIKIVNDL